LLIDNELGSLPQRTALERAIVTHLQAGRHWYFRPGRFRLWARSSRRHVASDGRGPS
jgi:hypothetical protein